ncbi:MAG: type II toxin-antitoxin system RelE/ParE family toxin [Fibromonadales bacterium]|nr:type II toxin-antitoxin system RelE/ParE family toxin [Fibromonadales bacterium]
MVIIQENDDLEKKPARLTLECFEMLAEAMEYIAENSLEQAEILRKRFFSILKILEVMPEIGTIYQNGLRKMKLGKFRYFIYYREKIDYISIVGIWHTSRGTEFIESGV